MSPETHCPRLHLVAAETAAARPAPRRTGAPDTEPGAGLIVAADVARVLGAATVMRLRADPALREYVCPFCDLPGRIRHPTHPAPADDDTAGPEAGAAAVLAIRYVNGMTVVRLAHPGCSPSAVLRVLRDARPVRHPVRAACWLRPTTTSTGAGGRMPVLLVDNQVRAWHRTRAREAQEYFPQALRSFGFTPLTDLDAAAPVVPGLTATITPLPRRTPDQPERVGPGRVAAVRVAARGEVVFDGHLDLPDPWAEAAATRGRVVVVAGTALTDPGPVIGRVWPCTPERLDTALGVAARAGRAMVGQAVLGPARGRRRRAPAGTVRGEAADTVHPAAATPGKRPGIGAAPDIPPPPNSAATITQETTAPDSGTVSALRPEAESESGAWWSGWLARYSGGRRWA
jgi:hypothetical protein